MKTTTKLLIAEFFCFFLLGFILGLAGIRVYSWQFWVIVSLCAIIEILGETKGELRK